LPNYFFSLLRVPGKARQRTTTPLSALALRAAPVSPTAEPKPLKNLANTLRVVSHYLSDSLSSLVQSTSLIKSLPFARTQCFTRAVLSSEEWFETHLIRDAEPYELALFRPAESRYDVPPESSLDRTAGEERWTATQRLGPQRAGGWDKASPLKEKKGAGDDPERCLKAAKRLLEI
jgi:hypothetical protein